MTVEFIRMEDGTAADYAEIAVHDAANAARQAERVLGWLRAMDGPSPYRVTRLEHSLQTATRAEADGADEELVICALLHDIGDELSPLNHSQVAASMLRPYVSEKNYWIVLQHGLFQGYYWFHHHDRDRNERDVHATHPWYQDCVDFCARWDQMSFDPDYVSAPLGYFEPMVQRLFAKEPKSLV